MRIPAPSLPCLFPPLQDAYTHFPPSWCLTVCSPPMQGAWRTDEIRRQKPSPQDEMRGGMSYMNSVIFDMIPTFHRRIDTALANLGQPRLPLNHSLFKWVGLFKAWEVQNSY